MTETLLELRELKTYYETYEGTAKAVDGLTFEIREGEIFGLVGESGCGKSTVALSVLRLVPAPGKIVAGEILFEEKNLLTQTEDEMRGIRGEKISFISQDPMAALNPVFKIGEQIADTLIVHRNLSKEQAHNLSVKKLEQVGLANPEGTYNLYPHELSGGMRQRAMIATALACDPTLLIADEPTTALDVTIQAQILDLLKDLCKAMSMTVLLITHNLGIVAEICDRLGVMYAGKLAEIGPVESFFETPMHPYTRGLLRAVPKATEEIEELETIRGEVPDLINPPKGCRFCPRCPHVMEECRKIEPPFFDVGPKHKASCYLYGR
jgi:peptide/nickel transport system ATP-binding protein/oligopeptide transport system ATP-binding protein